MRTGQALAVSVKRDAGSRSTERWGLVTREGWIRAHLGGMGSLRYQ